MRTLVTLAFSCLAACTPAAPPPPAAAQPGPQPTESPRATPTPTPTPAPAPTPTPTPTPTPADARAPTAPPPGAEVLHPLSPDLGCLTMYSACRPDGAGKQLCTSASYDLGCGQSGRVPDSTNRLVYCACP